MGRLAFGLAGFEMLIVKTIGHSEYLDFIFLNKFWEVCESDNIEALESYFNEISPYSILDTHIDNDSGNLSHLNEDEAIKLKNFYRTLPNNITDIMDLLTEVAFGNLYGGTGEYSELTYTPLLHIISILKDEQIDIDNITLRSLDDFSECHGWGTPKQKEMWFM